MMYITIIILPLIGSIVSGFFGRKVGVSGSQLITILSVMATTFIAVMVFWEIALNDSMISILTFRWIDTEWLYVFWAFNFDSLTSSMLIPVLIISFLVHFYSVGYMSHDPHIQRFFSYLSLFTFMMITLVTANNFLLMFVGWEGVGVCSYLLVNFWYTRIAANQSSMSAFLTNRVGDCFLTLGMFAILWTFGNLDYSTVFSLAPYINENAITIIGVCLLVGAMAKSSQIGLHVWLPLAMEGPTPVSALIHAATMVTAGVYLLMRSSPLIEYSSTILMLCLWVGSITTIFSSLIGLFQQDIKKVIAYSTMSQLGMMVIAIGLSSYNLALFHLINHAFYKGLLFLGAGSVIHAVADNQDFRKYGGLIKYLPLTYVVMLLASLSLMAFPFMTGYYSKDFILESAFGQSNYTSISVYYIAIIGAIFTTLYSIKVLYMTFLANPNGPLINYKNAHEGNIFMSLPLVILSVFSVYFGFISKDMFIGLGTDLFADNSIFIHPYHEVMLNTEFGVPKIYKLLPFIFTLLLIASFTYIFEFTKIFVWLKSNYIGYNIYNFFSLRFLIEFIYNKFIVRSILYMGGHTTKVLDKGSIEHIGPYGLGKLLFNISKYLGKLNSGIVTSYALYIVVGLILYILIIYANNVDISLFFFTIYAWPGLMFSGELFSPVSPTRSTKKINFSVVKSVFTAPGLPLVGIGMGTAAFYFVGSPMDVIFNLEPNTYENPTQIFQAVKGDLTKFGSHAIMRYNEAKTNLDSTNNAEDLFKTKTELMKMTLHNRAVYQYKIGVILHQWNSIGDSIDFVEKSVLHPLVYQLTWTMSDAASKLGHQYEKMRHIINKDSIAEFKNLVDPCIETIKQVSLQTVLPNWVIFMQLQEKLTYMEEARYCIANLMNSLMNTYSGGESDPTQRIDPDVLDTEEIRDKIEEVRFYAEAIKSNSYFEYYLKTLGRNCWMQLFYEGPSENPDLASIPSWETFNVGFKFYYFLNTSLGNLLDILDYPDNPLNDTSYNTMKGIKNFIDLQFNGVDEILRNAWRRYNRIYGTDHFINTMNPELFGPQIHYRFLPVTIVVFDMWFNHNFVNLVYFHYITEFNNVIHEMPPLFYGKDSELRFLIELLFTKY